MDKIHSTTTNDSYIKRSIVLEHIGDPEKIRVFQDILSTKQINALVAALKTIKATVENIPDADVSEVKHAYWFKTYHGGSKYGCSNCFKTADLSKQGKDFCSYCGAKMDAERK